MQKFACLLLLAALSMYSADNIAGKWSGSMTVSAAGGQTKDVGMALALQQNGSELTGTLTPFGKDPLPIQKGRSLRAEEISLFQKPAGSINSETETSAGRAARFRREWTACFLQIVGIVA
jgi:hypothetical protein